MLESLITRKYQTIRAAAFPPAALRALRLYGGLHSRFAAESRQFGGLGPGAAFMDLFGLGERHELWESLREFVLLVPWFTQRRGFLSSKSAQAIPERPQFGAVVRSPFDMQADHLSVPEPAERHRVENVYHRPLLPSVALPPGGQGLKHSPVSWSQVIEERYAPARWKVIATEGDDRGKYQKPDPAGDGLNPEFPAGSMALPVESMEVRGPDAFVPSLIPARVGRMWMGTETAGNRSQMSAGPVMSADANRKPIAPPRLAVSIQTPTPADSAAESIAEDATENPVDAPNGAWWLHLTPSPAVSLGIFQRRLLEPFFPGLKLDDVRIHADEPADRAARSLRADAFTLGTDIFFRSGRFNPFMPKGLALLGHELTHTYQVAGKETPRTSQENNELEHQAQSAEASLLRMFTAGDMRRQQELVPSPSVRGGVPYAAIHLESARPMTSGLDKRESAAGGVERSSSSPVQAGGAAVRQPLKAEEGRSIPAAGVGGATSTSQTEDSEGVTRALLRALDRKIRAERERRGIDRWVR